MAKVKVTGVKNVKRQIEIGLLRAARDQGMFQLISKNYIADVKDGIDPTTGQPYPPKTRQWVVQQGKLIKYGNKPDPFWSALKSNLTFTGQLVNSIKSTIQVSKSLITIEPRGIHRGYKNKGKGRQKNMTNLELANILAKNGRNLLGFNNKNVNKTINILRRTMRRFLNLR